MHFLVRRCRRSGWLPIYRGVMHCVIREKFARLHLNLLGRLEKKKNLGGQYYSRRWQPLWLLTVLYCSVQYCTCSTVLCIEKKEGEIALSALSFCRGRYSVFSFVVLHSVHACMPSPKHEARPNKSQSVAGVSVLLQVALRIFCFWRVKKS